MKHFTKGKEPRSLTQHRANAHSTFDNLPPTTKDEVRSYLLKEQGHICCYCMKRIPEPTGEGMKIEHWRCQADHPEDQLKYKNLFGACLGNTGQPSHLQTCDTKKGSQPLTINPTDIRRNCEQLLKYKTNGEIESDNPTTKREINNVLNLNTQSLVRLRKAVLDVVSKRVDAESRQNTDRNLKLRYLEQERQRWLATNDEKLKPFCMVAVYYLNKRIKQYH